MRQHISNEKIKIKTDEKEPFFSSVTFGDTCYLLINNNVASILDTILDLIDQQQNPTITMNNRTFKPHEFIAAIISIIHHECGHLKNNHTIRDVYMNALVPLTIESILLFVGQYNSIGNVWHDNALKIPLGLLKYYCYSLMYFANRRNYEWEADAVIPNEISALKAMKKILKMKDNDKTKSKKQYDEPWYKNFDYR